MFLTMTWSVEYYDTGVEKAVLALTSTLLARYLRYVDLMVEFGPDLGMPHTRALGGGLFELRIKSNEGIARVLYGAMVGKRIVMLHVFVKRTQKTPQRELRKARKRLAEVKRNEA